jgi:hypothetical protein
MKTKLISPLLVAALVAALTGCAPVPPKYDYSAFKAHYPKSILVLPPKNDSPDVKATYSVLAQATIPLAESGYYVFPVALVDETFRQNGLDDPAMVHQLPLDKLREIFGADAAMYITIRQYGTSYKVVTSESRVTADGSLIDLATGAVLWTGTATASSAEGRSNSGGGLVGLLVNAIVSQIVETLADRSHPIAGVMSQRLLAAGRPAGVLYGPRSPMFGKDVTATP